MRTLSHLTPEECVKIASIAFPEVDWVFIVSSHKWSGFDLIEAGANENTAEHIFQIDYQDDCESRFRFYENLHNFPISTTEIAKIEAYLESINCSTLI